MRARTAWCLLLTGLLAGSDLPAAKSRLAWERFQHAEWSTVRSLAEVPPEVIAALAAHLGEPFDANPARRLVLAGHSGSDWFMVYEQGGRDAHLVFVDFETAPRVRPVLLARGSASGLDLPGLTRALESGSMQWGDPDSSRY